MGNTITKYVLIGFHEEQSIASPIGAFMLARGVSRRRKVPNSQLLTLRSLRRMFSDIEFPRALRRFKTLATRMINSQLYENRTRRSCFFCLRC